MRNLTQVLWMLIVLILLISIPVFAAQQEIEVEMEEKTEIEIEEIETDSGFRFFYSRGGFGLGVLSLDFSYINDMMGALPNLDSLLFVSNWQIGMGAENGFRIGWSNTSGSQEKGAGKVFYDLEKKGIIMEFGYRPTPKIDLAAGTVFGRGTHAFNLVLGDADDIGDVINEAQTSSFKQRFWFLEPMVKAKFGLTSWASLNITVAYNFSFGPDEWLLNERVIAGEHLNSNGWRFGLTVGFGF